VLSLNITIASYVILGIVAYYGLLFILSFWRRVPPTTHVVGTAKPLVVIVVPARNEEVVIDGTLSAIGSLSYSGSFRALIMNDASSDATGAIAHDWAARDSRIRVIDRTPDEGGRGKSDVLNHAYRLVTKWGAEGDPWLAGKSSADDIVIGILDADGRLAPDCLEIVSSYFEEYAVGTTQVGVRIANSLAGTLTRMQDMEFVGFSWLVQIARDHLGSSGLGGNGQFTRLAALQDLGPLPWSPSALTEDLDLGLRLVERGWDTRFSHLTYVDQQGLDRWRPLLRQRTRWLQGHYQCWRHIPAILRSNGSSLAARVDLTLYLVLVVTVAIVSGTMLVNILAILGAVRVTDDFLPFIPPGIDYRACTLLLSFAPLSAFMVTYQRHSAHPFRWYEVPAYSVIFTLYTYVWLLATIRALARLAAGRREWVKTPRMADWPRGDVGPAQPRAPGGRALSPLNAPGVQP
jgi:cellulose synthase/poly-beta-1,6-N-acetylglucosamine synthase-like glycosyltransferase